MDFEFIKWFALIFSSSRSVDWSSPRCQAPGARPFTGCCHCLPAVLDLVSWWPCWSDRFCTSCAFWPPPVIGITDLWWCSSCANISEGSVSRWRRWSRSVRWMRQRRREVFRIRSTIIEGTALPHLYYYFLLFYHHPHSVVPSTTDLFISVLFSNIYRGNCDVIVIWRGLLYLYDLQE